MRKIVGTVANFASVFSLLAVAWVGTAQNATAASSILKTVQSRKMLNCGIHNAGLLGFAKQNNDGAWEGIDVAVCQAVAAAVLGDKTKINYRNLAAKERFTVLSSGEIDILSRNTTYTLSRDSDLKINFLPPNFYDGQGFMISKRLIAKGVNSTKQLGGARICIESGTSTELNMADYFKRYKMKVTPIVVDTSDTAMQNLMAGKCDSYTTDRSSLAANRMSQKNPDDFKVLPEIISKEPFAAAIREGDDQWSNITRWTMYVLIVAEEKNITSANIDKIVQAGANSDPEINRLLGLDGQDTGKYFGLDKDWAYRIIKQVGNYGELYHKHIDQLGLKKRGLNDLYIRGGLMYAPPFI
ncbi:MAG: amino acid ABC transporter substrate-binding protein [Hydrotalea sp.]|nr:amino acid ABC transporter substrate-binding protein [Hydrotalea sp.]